MAKVSVVIPVYNIAAHLCQCLDSVVGQTLTDLQIICVDDGSTDESPAILAEYAERDPRIRVIRQDNAGPGAARNTGLSQATGEYLIFLDSDDWFEVDFLRQMTVRAEETCADITICRSVEFDTRTGQKFPSDWMLKSQYLPKEVFSPEEVVDYVFQFTYGWPWDKLYRTAFVRRADLKYPELANSEDLVFVFPSLAVAERVAILQETLIHHRVNRSSSVSNSRHKDIDAPYRALILFRTELEQRKVYERFARSFLNWAMEFLVWNAANMPNRTAQQTYFTRLRQDYLPELQFDRYPADYYYSKTHYIKYLLVKWAPFPVFSGVVALHHRLKRNLQHVFRR